jgi:uncharacterized protein YeaO (DUF488 family)
MIATKRAYEPYEASDGYRVLVDRLWPRGISKERAHIDHWAKEISPSSELRQWYEHDPVKWPEFRRRYRGELRTPEAKAALNDLVRRARKGRVTLVYGSHAGDISNAAALKLILSRRVRQAKQKSRGARGT